MRHRISFSALLGLSLLLLPAVSQSQYSIKPYTLNVDDDGDYPFQLDVNRDGVPDFLGGSQNLVSANGVYSSKTLSGVPPMGAGIGG